MILASQVSRRVVTGIFLCLPMAVCADNSPVADAAQGVRTSRSELLEATTVADLLEQQARAAAALQKCIELGVRCGPGATLSDLSSTHTAPLPTTPAALPAALSGSVPANAVSQPILDPPDTLNFPDALVQPMPLIRTPARLPRLMGYASGYAQVEIEGAILLAKQGDVLPGGWTVRTATPRVLVLSNAADQVFRLTHRWGPRGPDATPSPAAFLPGFPSANMGPTLGMGGVQ